eukprot:4077872-Amphidinium_carterae.1
MSSWLEKIGRGRATNGVKASLWNALQHSVVSELEYVIVLWHAEQNVGLPKKQQWSALDEALGVESCTVEKLGVLSLFSDGFDDWLEKQRKSSTGIRLTAIEQVAVAALEGLAPKRRLKPFK